MDKPLLQFGGERMIEHLKNIGIGILVMILMFLIGGILFHIGLLIPLIFVVVILMILFCLYIVGMGVREL